MTWTERELAVEKAREDAEWAAGRCPYTGKLRHSCHRSVCDCFDTDRCEQCIAALTGTADSDGPQTVTPPPGGES